MFTGLFGGELGIRTLGTFLYTAFRVLHLRPLGQLSVYVIPHYFQKLLERTDGKNNKIFNFRTGENPVFMGFFSGANSQLFKKFRVRPVMTTSIPLHMRICKESKAVRLSLPNRSNILAKTTGDVNTNLPGNQNCKCRFVNDVLQLWERKKNLFRGAPIERTHREIVVLTLANSELLLEIVKGKELV